MHTGCEGNKSKTEALHRPKKLGEEPIPTGTQVNMKKNAYFHFHFHFHFTQSIIYLGSVIAACLRDSADISAHM
jgi:hypothetical protein